MASIVAVMLVVGVFSTNLYSQDHQHHAGGGAGEYALFDNLGNHAFDVTTSSDRVQDFFNQGLRLYYAFNHAEAVKSFREAQRLDPECAMCYWGEAMAWGPNINLPMDEPSAVEADKAMKRALDLIGTASPVEQQLIRALATRYTRIDVEDRADLDQAYAEAMDDLHSEHGESVEIAVLYAESIMNTMPWDYWQEDKTPRPAFRKALAALEFAMGENPDHPGACHFYIHGVEKYYPERAVECAERLAALMPGAGHIVHMPGHIYIRVGRYADAIEANKHAVHADETYIQDRRPGMGVYTAGYYPHNYDFMAFAASMTGDCELSIDAANNVRDVIPVELLGDANLTFVQHYYTRPLQMLAGCERWEEILNYDAPGEELVYARQIWHYARGRALVATGNHEEARKDLAAIRQARQEGTFEGMIVEPNEASAILAIAESVLEGWIAFAEGDYQKASTAMHTAIEEEDGLLYGEPPEWSVPVRHDLGSMQLKAGDYEAAVKTFEAALEKFPANAPATKGLEEARAGVGK